MDKRDSGANDFASLFFSAVAGIAGILAAVSPFFVKGGFISNLFIDKNSLELASIMGLIILLLGVWFFNFLSAFILFAKTDINSF